MVFEKEDGTVTFACVAKQKQTMAELAASLGIVADASISAER